MPFWIRCLHQIYISAPFCNIIAILETMKNFPEHNPPQKPSIVRTSPYTKRWFSKASFTQTHMHTYCHTTQTFSKFAKESQNKQEAQNQEESTTISTKKTNQFKKPQRIAFLSIKKSKTENITSMYPFRRKQWRHFSVKRLTCLLLSSVILCIEYIWWITQHLTTLHTQETMLSYSGATLLPRSDKEKDFSPK